MAKVTKVKVEVIPQTELVKIEKENKPVIRKAEALAIKVRDDETAAYVILKEIGIRVKSIESKRTAITKPLNASLKEVNALFKTLAQPLKTADVIIRDKILEFRTKREEAAAKKQAALEAKAEEAEEDGDKDRAIELSEKAESVTASVGESVVQKRWTFEAVDIDKIPREYLVPNEAAIRLAIREGVREIPGLKIYQKENIRI